MTVLLFIGYLLSMSGCVIGIFFSLSGTFGAYAGLMIAFLSGTVFLVLLSLLLLRAEEFRLYQTKIEKKAERKLKKIRRKLNDDD